MAIRDSLSDFYGWWRTELAGMIPSRLQRNNRRPTAASLTVRRDGILIAPTDPGSKVQTVIAPDVAGAMEFLRQNYFRMRIARPSVSLLIDRDRYLKRQLSALRLPPSRLAAMSRLDMSASTPFSPDDAHLICRQASEANPASTYIVVKKAFLDPLIDELRAAGIVIRDLSFVGDDDFKPDVASLQSILPEMRWRSISSRIRSVAVAVCVLGVALTIGHAFWRNIEAKAELDQLIDVAENRATVVKALIEARKLKISQISAIRNEKRDAVPLVSILEEMSRVIPDSTWLTDIQVDGGKVLFSGFSKSAAALIPRLEASELFSAPTFRSPVVRVANQQGERFSISMDVEATDG